MSVKDVHDQLVAFDDNDGPTDAGDTLMGSIAQRVVAMGWAKVDSQGRYWVTYEGKKVADEIRRGVRG